MCIVKRIILTIETLPVRFREGVENVMTAETDKVRVEPKMEPPPEVIWEGEDAWGTCGRVVWNDGNPSPQVARNGLWHGCDWPAIDVQQMVFDLHWRASNK